MTMRRKAMLTLLALMLGAWLTAAPAASAASAAPLARAVLLPADVAYVQPPPANCSGSWGFMGGRFLCTSRVFWTTWYGGKGNTEYFGVGTDSRIYHWVKGWSAWQLMPPGIAQDIGTLGYDYYGSPSVGVFAKDDSEWCTEWIDIDSYWTPWHSCSF